MDVDTLPSGTGDLPSSLIYHRHILPGRSLLRPHAHRSHNYSARSAAKRLQTSRRQQSCRDEGLDCWPEGLQCPRCSAVIPPARRRRFLQEHVIDTGRSPRSRNRWVKGDGEDEDDRELARSAVPLPSDRYRLVRTPSLEREDAFRDASTTKGNVHLQRHPVNEDAELAELYRMGLLYDDEQDHAEAVNFNLNSIKHQEPLYSIRPAKRSRKSKSQRRHSELDQPLYLDLSFTDLGNDHTIAQFLSPDDLSSQSEAVEDDEPALREPSSARAFAPLRVIYELDGSQPDIDVDTSQPPDLVVDLLSDYDYFSDSDLDDLPLQREVRDSAATPGSEPWVVLGGDS
ncbi:hypothetical protein BGZ63DRAFT_373264 [Mariannaea sp. PMI_226]|nr:hypothetical protein BGZ63DRAFT_373264 [Mariannaea sp. PMI_226]